MILLLIVILIACILEITYVADERRTIQRQQKQIEKDMASLKEVLLREQKRVNKIDNEKLDSAEI